MLCRSPSAQARPMLSITWEPRGENRLLRADARPNRSSARAVLSGDGRCFYAMQKSQQKSGLQHATRCMIIWQKASLPQFIVQDPSCRNVCTKPMRLCVLGGTNTYFGGLGSSSWQGGASALPKAEISPAKSLKLKKCDEFALNSP